MYFASTALAGTLLITSAFSSPIGDSHGPQPKVKELLELPNVWIENLAVRSNGDLILDTVGQGRVYSFNPKNPRAGAQVIAQIDGVNAIAGVAEIGEDIFAVAGSVYDEQAVRFKYGSMKLVEINFRNCAASQNGKPTTRTILEKTDAGPFNGMTALPSQKHIILGADPQRGYIWRVNTKTGVADLAIKDELLAPGPTGPFTFGLNGIKLFGGYIYFTNTRRQSFGRVKIDQQENKVGPVQIIYQVPAGSTHVFDDFDIVQRGNAYVTVRPGLIYKIASDGSYTVALKDTMVNPTSAAFSRDFKSLYIVTAGQSDQPASGGQVVELKF